jgi:SAM-dependent methyltransferase
MLYSPLTERTEAPERDGYLDMACDEPQSMGAQRLFEHAWFASIYASLFRPVLFSLTGSGTMKANLQRARAALKLCAGQLLLDVGLRSWQFHASPVGRSRSRRPRHRPRTLRANACASRANGTKPGRPERIRASRRAGHPFADATFDAVYCPAALDLVPNPSAVVTEMARVLKPGGRVAIATTYEGRSAVARQASAVFARLVGSRMFDGDTFMRLFRELDFRDMSQELRGFHPYIDAAKP